MSEALKLKDGRRCQVAASDISELSQQDTLEINQLVEDAFDGQRGLPGGPLENLGFRGRVNRIYTIKSEGRVIATTAASLFRGFGGAEPGRRTSVIYMSNAATRESEQRNGAQRFLLDQMFADMHVAIPAAVQQRSEQELIPEREKEHFPEEATKETIMAGLANFTVCMDTSLNRESGASLRRVAVEMALKHGWSLIPDKNTQEYILGSGGVYQFFPQSINNTSGVKLEWIRSNSSNIEITSQAHGNFLIPCRTTTKESVFIPCNSSNEAQIKFEEMVESSKIAIGDQKIFSETSLRLPPNFNYFYLIGQNEQTGTLSGLVNKALVVDKFIPEILEPDKNPQIRMVFQRQTTN